MKMSFFCDRLLSRIFVWIHDCCHFCRILSTLLPMEWVILTLIGDLLHQLPISSHSRHYIWNKFLSIDWFSCLVINERDVTLYHLEWLAWLIWGIIRAPKNAIGLKHWVDIIITQYILLLLVFLSNAGNISLGIKQFGSIFLWRAELSLILW